MNQSIIDFISELSRTPVRKLSIETDFKIDLCFDSLDLVEMFMKIEDKYDIEISELEADNCNTIGGLEKLVWEKIKKGKR
jgi:acyl carrier protein